MGGLGCDSQRFNSFQNYTLHDQEKYEYSPSSTDQDTAPVFRTLNILDIFNINAFFVACFIYSYHNNLLPNAFNTTFVIIAKYSHIILEMLITTDHIFVKQTLNSRVHNPLSTCRT